MIYKKTVLVLGAGASMDFGYPSGEGLKEQIVACQQGSLPQVLKQCLDEQAIEQDQVDDFLEQLRFSGCSSVDIFLEQRPEFIGVGKIFMAYFLLRCESLDDLFWLTGNRNNWYQILFQSIATDFVDFANNALSIVTLNYDRSLETYLYQAIKSYYGKSDPEVVRALSNIPIVHVYGMLGGLPWEGGSRPYRSDHDHDDICAAASSMVIISEGTWTHTSFNIAREILRSPGNRIIFLGFGYHKENLERLDLDYRGGNHTYFGTCYGLGEAEIRKISLMFKQSGINFGESPMKIHEYLRNVITL
jgi:hypothetical protein